MQPPFMAQLMDDPADEMLRSICADELESKGDPRGEYLRVEAAQVAATLRLHELEPWAAAPGPDEKPFLDAIDQEDDPARADALREVYADWLEERGDGRAELVRVQVRLHVTAARLAELTPKLDPAWLALVARRYRVYLVGCGPDRMICIRNVRAIRGYGLKEAKPVVDAASEQHPFLLRDEITADEVTAMRVQFENAGRLRAVPISTSRR